MLITVINVPINPARRVITVNNVRKCRREEKVTIMTIMSESVKRGESDIHDSHQRVTRRVTPLLIRG